ncbi:MAG: hypothetical protein ACLGGW_03735, partial [Gammaproteobacteria bacterium]
FLSKLSGAAPNATDFASIRINADWLCVIVSFACLVFATLEGLAYNNLAQALGWGIPLFLSSLAITRWHAGQPLTMHINAALLVGMGALHVHLARGLLEYHFSFFMLLPVMLAYRDTRPLLSMGLFIVIHHIVFDMLQQAGFECYIFRGPFSGMPAVALHGFYVAVAVLLLSVIAQTLRQHALAAEEGTKLLAYLDKEKGINLRVRAQTDEHGRMSRWGRSSTIMQTTWLLSSQHSKCFGQTFESFRKLRKNWAQAIHNKWKTAHRLPKSCAISFKAWVTKPAWDKALLSCPRKSPKTVLICSMN